MTKTKKKPILKLLLTGGHAATTAISVIECIKKDSQLKDLKLYWVGAKTHIEGKTEKGIEHQVLPKMGVRMYTITAGRLQRKLTRFTIPSLIKIPFGFIESFLILNKTRPNAVLSFGGYVGLPVVVCAWILRIPCLLHEQTVAVGLANKVSSFFVKKVLLAREQSKSFFNHKNIEVTGQPIIRNIISISPKKTKSSPPVLFITCGSRGSQIINRLLTPILPKILKDFKVIHQTGETDYLTHIAFCENLPLSLRSRYKVYKFINPLFVYKKYEECDLILARSGANTVAEILQVRRPSILIPIPWTRYNEQVKNAAYAKDNGIAVVLNQNSLDSELLYKTIVKVDKMWNKMVGNSSKHPSDKEASQNVVNCTKELLMINSSS